MRPALARVLFGLAVLASLFVASPPAQAQSIILQPAGQFYRKQPLRTSPSQQPHWVSQGDCLAKDVISFPITMTGFFGYTLQVWAGDQGTDCTQVTARQGSTAVCWLLYSQPAQISPLTIDISAVDLVARKTPLATDTSTSVSAVMHGTYPDACLNAGSPTGQALSLYFFFVTGGPNVMGTPQIWSDIGYDIAAPNAPTDVVAGSGETRARVT